MSALLAIVAGPVLGALLLAALLSDAATGATLAGVFSIVNTVLNAYLVRKTWRTQHAIEATHELLRAPRRAVYDSEGRVMGTVLRLDAHGDPRPRHELLPRQRSDDPPPELDV